MWAASSRYATNFLSRKFESFQTATSRELFVDEFEQLAPRNPDIFWWNTKKKYKVLLDKYDTFYINEKSYYAVVKRTLLIFLPNFNQKHVFS